MASFKEMCSTLEGKIEQGYTEGLTMEQAEKLAGEFLHAQLVVSGELKKADLDSRMRKSGVKAVRAAVYLTEVQSKEKKPTESQLEHTINTDPTVSGEQDAYDKAEVDKSELERLYSIFSNAHVFYRGIAKGSFGG